MSRYISFIVRASWGLAEYLVYPILMLAATPILLKALGTAGFAQWVLLTTVTGAGGVASLGMAPATTKEVSTHLTVGDVAGVVDAIRAGLVVALLSSVVFAIIASAFGFFAADAVFPLIGTPSDLQSLFLCASAIVVFDQLDGVYAGAIRGMEQPQLVGKVELLLKSLTVLVTVGIALATHRVVYVFVALVGMSALRVLVKALVLAAIVNRQIFVPKWNRRYISSAFRFGKWTTIQSIGSVVFASGDRFIIGTALGADALNRYSLCLQLAQQVHAIPSAALAFMFPIVNRKVVMGDVHSLRKIMKISICAVTILAAALAVPLAIFGHDILRVWVGAEIAAQASPLLPWLSLGFMTLAINTVPHYMLFGFNSPQVVAISNLAAGIITLFACSLLITNIGEIGAAMSRTIYGVIISINFLFLLRKLSEISRER